MQQDNIELPTNNQNNDNLNFKEPLHSWTNTNENKNYEAIYKFGLNPYLTTQLLLLWTRKKNQSKL